MSTNPAVETNNFAQARKADAERKSIEAATASSGVKEYGSVMEGLAETPEGKIGIKLAIVESIDKMGSAVNIEDTIARETAMTNNFNNLKGVVEQIINKTNVSRALTRLPTGFNSTNYNLTDSDTAVFADGTNVALSPELRTNAQKEIRKRVANVILENWNPQNESIETKIDSLANDPQHKDQMLIESLRAISSERESAEFETLKKQFETGLLSDADFRAKFEGSTPSITNTSLRKSLERYYNDPSKEEERKAQKDKEKEKADKQTMKDSSTQYFNQLSGAGGFDENGLDVDQVVNGISTAPGFAELPTPVREAIMRHLKLKGEGIKMDREIDVAKTAESQAKAQIESININRAAFATFMKRFRWIALGAAIGGLGGYFVPGITGVAGALLGSAAGGASGLLLGNHYDKSIMEGVAATNLAQQKHLESRKAISDVAAAKIKREINATTAYTKTAALVQASVTGVDSEKMISAYLKSAGLKDIDAILAFK